MRIKVSDIKKTLTRILEAKGFADSDAAFIIDMYLGGELRGHESHGLASFPGFLNQDYSNLPEPEVLKTTSSAIVIDAKSNPGVLVGKWAADEAIQRARKELVGVALIKNMESWLRPGAIAEYISSKGLIAIVMNDGGGVSIAPPGGFDPTLGTNPLAFGIPTPDNALVVDMATSKKAWGQVRLANKYRKDLPTDTFYDDEGSITLDPKRAHSVKPFGDYKGFALSLLIEVLCGSLLGMSMMGESKTGNSFGDKLPDRGAVIIVFDPSQTVDQEKFEAANLGLLRTISATRSLPNETIRIPGAHASEIKAKYLSNDSIDLPEELWEEIKSL